MFTGISTSIVAAAVAALALAVGAPAKPTSSAGYDVAALQAINGRYQAMAEHYGTTQGYSTRALDALNARYAGMAEHYGVQGGTTSKPDGYQPQLHGDASDVFSRAVDRQASTVGVGIGREKPDGYQPQLSGREAVPVSGTDDGFDWRDFGIATGSALMLALLGGAALLATRTRDRVAHP